MPNFAIIQNGVVVNTAYANEEFATEQGWVLLQDGFGINDLYDGVNFSHAPEVQAKQLQSPTKEQLLAQLQALSAQIQSLE